MAEELGDDCRERGAGHKTVRLIYARHAVDDLVRLRRFIEAHDPGAAALIAEALVSRIESLVHFPRLGAPVQFAPDADVMRDLVCGRYIVRYALRPGLIIVLRLWQQREDERKRRT